MYILEQRKWLQKIRTLSEVVDAYNRGDTVFENAVYNAKNFVLSKSLGKINYKQKKVSKVGLEMWHVWVTRLGNNR